jgi:hypothetical protein
MCDRLIAARSEPRPSLPEAIRRLLAAVLDPAKSETTPRWRAKMSGRGA